jgi:hypothetical protein
MFRLKELKDKPYTQEEAEAAVGLKRETRRDIQPELMVVS